MNIMDDPPIINSLDCSVDIGLFRKTRSKNVCEDCPIFGALSAICPTMLPTYRSLMKDYLFVRHTMRNDGRQKEPSVFEIVGHVAFDVEKIWIKASVPVLSQQRVRDLVKTYYDQYRNLMKPYKERKTNKQYMERVSLFQQNSNKLFDIAACKCLDFSACHCHKDNKVPLQERKFLIDQRTDRRMMIGNVDRRMTQQILKKQIRKERRSSNLSNIVVDSPVGSDQACHQDDTSKDDSLEMQSEIDN